MTDLQRPPTDINQPTAPAEPDPPFRPASRRRNRIAAGVALAALAVAGNLLVYAGLDDAEPAVQVVRDVPAGSEITADMLRTVDVDVDGTVEVVPGDRLGELLGQHAKVRLVAGSLVTTAALQDGPLLADGTSVVAIRVPEGALPIGLRERAPVELVLPDTADPARSGASLPGRVVGLPTEPSSAVGTRSVSVEVAAADAPAIAAADDVRVVLVQPRPDPAVDPAADETAAG